VATPSWTWGSDYRATGSCSLRTSISLLPQGRLGSRFSLDAGTKKSVNRGKGEIVVNATDLLNTNQARLTIRGTDFSLVSTDYFETQVIRVGYNWKFSTPDLFAHRTARRLPIGGY
jgi:hypothetical protein